MLSSGIRNVIYKNACLITDSGMRLFFKADFAIHSPGKRETETFLYCQAQDINHIPG